MGKKNKVHVRRAAKAGNAVALHVTDGDHDHTAFGQLRVLITREGGVWFAQGLEIDYAASGTSLEDVKDRFSRGFCMTVQAHLEQFGTIDKLLKFAPSEALEPFAPQGGDVRMEHFSTVMEHEVCQLGSLANLPPADRMRLPCDLVFVTPAAA